MNTERAMQIICDNHKCKENSFLWLLFEKELFSREQFWLLYDSIEFLVTAHIRSEILDEQIVGCVERFMKELIFHFDPHDMSVLEGLPEDHMAYQERLEAVQNAYLRGDVRLLSDDRFELQKYK